VLVAQAAPERRRQLLGEALRLGLAIAFPVAAGLAAAAWLAKQDPMLLGADNWPVEVGPNPDAQLSLPVHQLMLVVQGIHLLENLKLDELSSKRVHEFAFVVQPLKMQGFSGSTVAPIAPRIPWRHRFRRAVRSWRVSVGWSLEQVARKLRTFE